MAVDTAVNHLSNTTSLFRPVPASRLQSNLAQYYERTSEFVNEQFEKFMDETPSEKKQSRVNTSNDDGEQIKLQPKGIGAHVDLYI